MPRPFVTLDVFTAEAFAGNPLAVVLEAEDLDTDGMQAIAREFNLSETVFVLTPSDPRQRADIRIFTPARELPFAGHPTVGTAVLLALLDQKGLPGAVAFGLKEQVGIVPCAVEVESATGGSARFRLPRLPITWGDGKESSDCAWALGLDPTEIGFERHVPSRHSAGVAFDLIRSHRSTSWRARSRASTSSQGSSETATTPRPTSIRAIRARGPAGSERACSVRGWGSRRTLRRVPLLPRLQVR